jgi:hypothetical protein
MVIILLINNVQNLVHSGACLNQTNTFERKHSQIGANLIGGLLFF